MRRAEGVTAIHSQFGEGCGERSREPGRIRDGREVHQRSFVQNTMRHPCDQRFGGQGA